jgi:hypothetical protein
MLLNSVDVNHLGVLSLVGMVCTIVNVEVLDELTTETVFGEHALHNAKEEGVHTGLEVLVEGFLHENLGSLLTLTAGIACVVKVNFVSHLVAGENHFVGVDDNNVVATSYVGRVAGLVFATKDFSNLGTEAAERLISSVDNYPFLVYARGVRGKGFVD